ncbi:MAG: hypothetical protein AAF960_22485 [Bacteroidota bacterium]
MIAYLEPFTGIGEFKFGKKIDDFLHLGHFDVNPPEKYSSKSYTMQNPEITIWVNEANLIETIGCYEECLYKGRNMIEMKIDEFIAWSDTNYYGKPDILDFEENSDIPQKVYEFEDIGLQIWTKLNVIITVIASEYESYGE